MEAKDTVLGTVQDAVWDFEKFKLDQAEVSFKAGFNEALNTVVATREYDEGKKAGMREKR